MTVILVLILLIQVIADAVPITRELDPMIIDGEEGILIEIPEYEDTELLDYELSEKGGVPIMSLIQLPKSGPWSQAIRNKNTIIDEKEAIAEAKFELYDIVKKLKMLHTQTGSSNHQEELSKGFYKLKKLRNDVTPEVHALLKAIKQSLQISKSFVISGTKTPLMPSVINDYIQVDTPRPEASGDRIPDNSDYDSEEFYDE